MQRLQRKVDYPEFFQGVMHLSDRDHDARIELHYRPQEPHRSPLKIGEWNATWSLFSSIQCCEVSQAE